MDDTTRDTPTLMRHWSANVCYRTGMLHLGAIRSSLETLRACETAQDTRQAIRTAREATKGLSDALTRLHEMACQEVAHVG